jgi:hypothetical protein
MRDFIINEDLLEYNMHVLTIDKSMYSCYDSVEPISYLCDELIKLGASYKKEHRTYYKFHCTPENLNLIFDVFKTNDFKIILEKYILESTKTKIEIKNILLDFKIDTYEEFFSQFYIQISLINIPYAIDKQKIENKILKSHLELNIKPNKVNFKVILCSEDRLSIQHTIEYDKEIKPENLSYLKNIEKSIYNVDYKKNSVLINGFTTMPIKDVIHG